MKLRKQEQGQGVEKENTLRDTGKAEDQIGKLETGEAREAQCDRTQEDHPQGLQEACQTRWLSLEKAASLVHDDQHASCLHSLNWWMTQ